MRRVFRAAVWILLLLAALAIAVRVALGALQAHGTAQFNRWIAWAAVAAVLLAAVGALPSLWDKITGSLAPSKIHRDVSEGVSDGLLPGGLGRSGDTLPLRNPAFTGRTEALEELEKRLAVGPVAVVALRGLGGMGKSQLALEYAHQIRQSGRYQLAGWVRSDSTVTIAEDLAKLAPILGLSVEGTVGEVAAAVVSALGAQQDWLVVFDNAQKPGDLVGMQPGGRGHVLITSRNQVWSGSATQVDLAEFSRAESVKFLCERSRRDEPEAAGELADDLGDLPLALAQAAAYIDTRSLTIREYLELYRDPELALTLRDAGLDNAEYPASVAQTWLLSFRQLSNEQPAAVELLRLCAFLDPDDIDLDLLSTGQAETGDVVTKMLGSQLERTEAAGALAAKSLVTVPAEGHLRVHRLVQAVTRDQLTDTQATEWVKRALSMIAAGAPPGLPEDYRSWPVYARLAPHIEVVTGYASTYPALTEKMLGILRDLGVYLSESGQFNAACTIRERILAIAEAAYDPGHTQVAIALGNLGQVQVRLGDLAEARTNLELALAAFQEAYGPNHRQVAITLVNLGVLHWNLGELREARTSMERALAIYEAVSGPNHPDVDTAKCLVNLGNLQLELGEPKEGLPRIERGLAIYAAVYGPSHRDFGVALVNLGVVQLRLWKLREAHASFVRAVPILQAADEYLGRSPTENVMSMMNLRYVKRHKLFGAFFFVFFLFSVFRAVSRAGR